MSRAIGCTFGRVNPSVATELVERQQAVRQLLETASAAISGGATHPVETAGAARLAAVLKEAAPKSWSPSSIPVVGELGALPTSELLAATRPGLDALAWIPSHRVDDNGAKVGLAHVNEAFELGDLGVGIIAIGAHSDYPVHNHPPAEVYLVLGGTAEWRWGGAVDFATVEPGCVIHNNPHDWHAIRTGADPVVALWVLHPVSGD